MVDLVNSIDLSSGTIRYLDVGAGPPVVFVHGLLVDHQLWSPVIAELSGRFRCVAPDWPLGSHTVAMGDDADLSPAGVAALIAELLETLDLRDVTLVGNDSGGAISQLVAANHPERLGRLVLTNCDALEVFPPKGFGYLSWLPRIPGAMWILAKLLNTFGSLRRLPSAYGKLTREPIADSLLDDWTRPAAENREVRRDAGKFARGVSRQVTLDVAGRLGGFAHPALLLWGADDTFFTVELAERLRACFADARLETIAGAATFVPLDQPREVAAAITSFVSA